MAEGIKIPPDGLVKIHYRQRPNNSGTARGKVRAAVKTAAEWTAPAAQRAAAGAEVVEDRPQTLAANGATDTEPLAVLTVGCNVQLKIGYGESRDQETLYIWNVDSPEKRIPFNQLAELGREEKTPPSRLLITPDEQPGQVATDYHVMEVSSHHVLIKVNQPLGEVQINNLGKYPIFVEKPAVVTADAVMQQIRRESKVLLSFSHSSSLPTFQLYHRLWHWTREDGEPGYAITTRYMFPGTSRENLPKEIRDDPGFLLIIDGHTHYRSLKAAEDALLRWTIPYDEPRRTKVDIDEKMAEHYQKLRERNLVLEVEYESGTVIEHSHVRGNMMIRNSMVNEIYYYAPDCLLLPVHRLEEYVRTVAEALLSLKPRVEGDVKKYDAEELNRRVKTAWRPVLMVNKCLGEGQKVAAVTVSVDGFRVEADGPEELLQQARLYEYFDLFPGHIRVVRGCQPDEVRVTNGERVMDVKWDDPESLANALNFNRDFRSMEEVSPVADDIVPVEENGFFQPIGKPVIVIASAEPRTRVEYEFFLQEALGKESCQYVFVAELSAARRALTVIKDSNLAGMVIADQAFPERTDGDPSHPSGVELVRFAQDQGISVPIVLLVSEDGPPPFAGNGRPDFVLQESDGVAPVIGLVKAILRDRRARG